jgi:hypothetical protein
LGIRTNTEDEYKDMVADMISFLKGETKFVKRNFQNKWIILLQK